MRALAIPWLILQATGSVVWTGIIASGALGSMLLGSVLSHRMIRYWGAHTVINASFIANIISIAGLLYCFSLESVPILPVLVFVAIGTSLDAVGNIAVESCFPEIASATNTPLAKISGIKDSLMTGALILGPALAGWMLASYASSFILLITLGLVILALISFQKVVGFYKHAHQHESTSLYEILKFLWSVLHLRSYVILLVIVMASVASIDDVMLPAL
ncbi:MAG: hypothetical protein MK137_07630, partial [Rickettsiales bacterium]|nr:hypothetical protein [Rickettsiales bacterium]